MQSFGYGHRCNRSISSRHRNSTRSLVKGINSDQFTTSVSSGFLIDESRSEFIQARFVEKDEIKESFLDPFGNKTEGTRIQYTQVEFRLQRQAPQLEIYNAPRQINAFLNRLGEFTRGAAAIYSPEISVDSWLRALNKEATSLATIGAIISDLELGDSVIAKAALTGDQDVRKYVNLIANGRKYRLVQARVKVIFENVEAKFTINPESRLTITSGEDGVESSLRSCLKAIL